MRALVKKYRTLQAHCIRKVSDCSSGNCRCCSMHLGKIGAILCSESDWNFVSIWWIYQAYLIKISSRVEMSSRLEIYPMILIRLISIDYLIDVKWCYLVLIQTMQHSLSLSLALPHSYTRNLRKCNFTVHVLACFHSQYDVTTRLGYIVAGNWRYQLHVYTYIYMYVYLQYITIY